MADVSLAFSPPPGKITDISGNLYGRLLVRGFHHKDEWRSPFWTCECSCGNVVVVCGKKLKSGHTQSCGCLRRELTSERAAIHRMSKTSTYQIWSGMHTRCSNSNATRYDCYGGRGIRVCDRWNSFECFLQDMGERPEKMTIERIDNNGNYEPSNCCWATKKTQARNQRSNHRITYTGCTKTLVEWAEDTGLTYSALKCRIRKAKPLASALRPEHQNFHMVSYEGKTQSIAAWSRELGMSYYKLRSRLQRGWSDHDAISVK
jgi:hypothetical protein